MPLRSRFKSRTLRVLQSGTTLQREIDVEWKSQGVSHAANAAEMLRSAGCVSMPTKGNNNLETTKDVAEKKHAFNRR